MKPIFCVKNNSITGSAPMKPSLLNLLVNTSDLRPFYLELILVFITYFMISRGKWTSFKLPVLINSPNIKMNFYHR